MRRGDFELDRRVGEGGMGVVYLAVHRATRQRCAVKLLKPERAEHPRAVELFLREVRASARLDHSGILRVFDAGTHAEGPWFAMERAEVGLDERPVQNWPEVVEVLRVVLSALAHAHARGVVHRDIKPENLLYCRVGGSLHLKLCDFGIARLDHEVRGIRAGTPGYMAPEQAFGSAGPATDLFAVGVLAYELLTGVRPFAGVPLPGERASSPVPRFTTPAGVLQWVERLLAVDPSQRPGDAAVALHALEAAAGGHAPAWARPALPPTWRGQVHDSLQVEVVRMGIGLAGLREPPLVGRGPVQDRLWAMLLEVEAQGMVQAVELRVPPGEGGSRLGRWLAERTAEVGGQGLYVTGGLGPTDGLHGLSERLEASGVAAPVEGSVVDRVLGQLRAACEGPTVLWIDAGPGDISTARLVRHLLRFREDPLALLVVLTTEPETPWALDGQACACIDVGPLPVEAKVRALVRGLALAPDAAEALAAVAPNLRRAIDRVTTGASVGRIQLGPHGYELGELTDDVAEAARLQLTTVSAEALGALQVAALLGQVIAPSSWERACQRAGRSRGGAEAEGVARGVLREEVGGRLAFARDGLRDALVGSLFPAEARRLHVACAEALVVDGTEAAGRRGAHLLEAGQLDRAFEELLAGLGQRYQPEQVHWLALAGACLARLRLPPDDIRWGQWYGERVQLHLHRHTFDKLRDAIDQLVAWMDAHDGWARDPFLVDPAVRAAVTRGRLDDAAQWLAPALEHLERDPSRLLRLHGLVMQHSGRFDQATASYRRALKHLPEDESPLTLMNDIAVSLESSGLQAEALAAFEACLALPELGERLTLVRLNIAGTLLELDRAAEAVAIYDALDDVVARTTDAQVVLAHAIGRTLGAAVLGDDASFTVHAPKLGRLIDTVRLKDRGVSESLARHAGALRRNKRSAAADRLRALAEAMCRTVAERSALDAFDPPLLPEASS